MLTLVIGGGSSGKSAYAESLLSACTADEPKIYIATMQGSDAETLARIKKHQKMRAGKCFLTRELPILHAETLQKQELSGSGMLECVSNLVANECYGAEGYACSYPKDANYCIAAELEERVADQIIEDIVRCGKKFRDFIVVTNNVFEDGILYDPSTMQYMRILAKVNRGLARIADTCYEVCVGIPIRLK